MYTCVYIYIYIYVCVYTHTYISEEALRSYPAVFGVVSSIRSMENMLRVVECYVTILSCKCCFACPM